MKNLIHNTTIYLILKFQAKKKKKEDGIVKFNETKNLSIEVKMTDQYINQYQNLQSINTLIPHLENE